ncbi:MAG: ribonuclease Z [Marinobacterium sp.]|nr:ribonuclease Z [Marinobacterium sp.]
MKITFLGTASGAPGRERNVSATAVQPANGRAWVLVDCGEATQHQLLRTALSPQRLAAILITHVHGDHCYGLPGLLASCQLNGRTAPLTIVGPADIWHYLQAVIRFTQLQIGFELRFVDVSDALALEVAGLAISAVSLSHRVPCWGYRLQEVSVERRLNIQRLRYDGVIAGPEWGLLQKGQDVRLADGRLLRSADYTCVAHMPRAVVVAGDNDQPELLAPLCDRHTVLVHEATYTNDVLQQVGPEPQHSSAAMVAEFASKAGLQNLILTHFSPRYLKRPRRRKDRSMAQLRSEAQAGYCGNLFLAEDFQCYQIASGGDVSLLQDSPSALLNQNTVSQ